MALCRGNLYHTQKYKNRDYQKGVKLRGYAQQYNVFKRSFTCHCWSMTLTRSGRCMRTPWCARMLLLSCIHMRTHVSGTARYIPSFNFSPLGVLYKYAGQLLALIAHAATLTDHDVVIGLHSNNKVLWRRRSREFGAQLDDSANFVVADGS